MIVITAKKDGFRRAGIAHPARPTEHADDSFTPAQMELLQAEPMLLVQVTEAAGKDGGGPISAKELIPTIKVASLEQLEGLAEGEERKSVLEAIETRRKELAG